jgi:two-component system sensor histidine kinase UhpB
MNAEIFDEHMEKALQRLSALQERGRGVQPIDEALTAELMEELSIALQELQVASSELESQSIEAARLLQRYQDLFEFAPDAYVETDEQGIIRQANRAAGGLFRASLAQLTGHTLASYIVAGERRSFRLLTTHMATTDQVRDRDLDIQPREGAPVACSVSALALRERSGETTGLLWLIRDITERKQALQQVERMNAELDRAVTKRTQELQGANTQLRQLAQKIVSVQEEERRLISHELHDESGQALTALKMNLEAMRDQVPDELPRLRKSIDEAIVLTSETMSELRTLAHDLRPPSIDTVEVDSLLEGVCRDFRKRSLIAIRYFGDQAPPLEPAVSITFYRLLQEALTNIARHANATQVRVAFQQDAEALTLTVEDNGDGFDYDATLAAQDRSKGIGILGMEERLKTVGGRLEIHSAPGKGTRLVAYVPLKETE